MYLTLKSLHIIFVVTWFAGLFYIFRLFVYHRIHSHQLELTNVFCVMERRLLYFICLPSSVIASWVALHLCLILPTAIQPFFQKKLFKIISRLLLGIGISSYFINGLINLTPPLNIWAFRFLLICAFLAVYQSLSLLREKYKKDPCKTCPLGRYPLCDWNMPRIMESGSQNIVFGQLMSHEKDLIAMSPD